jgi:hypothetical protein
MIVANTAWILAASFFGFEEYGAVFCEMVNFATVVHAVWRLVCVWASAATIASA